MYYLNSRYYDPATGRFLNADVFINANGDLTGFNMYAYCSNNPVMGYDPTGEFNWGKLLVSGSGAIAVGIMAGINERARHVDFEKDQTAKTYIRRYIGNFLTY